MTDEYDQLIDSGQAFRPRVVIGALSCSETTGGEAISSMLIADMLQTEYDVAILTGSNETNRSNVHELRLGPLRAAVPMLLRLPMRLVGIERQVRQFLLKIRPDLIHLQDANLIDPVVPVACQLGIPVIVSLRDLHFVPSFHKNRLDGNGCERPRPWARAQDFLELFQWNRPLSWPLPLLLPWLYAKPARQRALMEQATILLPLSNYVKEELTRCGIHAPCEVMIQVPVPEWPWRPLRNADDIRFIFIGRLVEGKGVDILLKSFSQVLLTLPRAELLIAGDGPKRQQLERLAKQLGCFQQTRFVGYVAHDKIHHLLEDVDIVVFPSKSPETFGRVAVEAAMVGRPIIAARSGGLPEFIGTDRGILVSPGDVDELAMQMLTLAGDRSRQAQLAEAGRRHASQFTAANIKVRLTEIYRQVLAAHTKNSTKVHD